MGAERPWSQQATSTLGQAGERTGLEVSGKLGSNTVALKKVVAFLSVHFHSQLCLNTHCA